MSQSEKKLRPAGYAELVRRFGLNAIPNWHVSQVGGSTRRVEHLPGQVKETFPKRFWPGDGLGDHLEFALKYDGTNLALLQAIFECAPAEELVHYIRSKPGGKYARRLWFFYEWLTGRRLPLEDISRRTAYVDLLDSRQYYTVSMREVVRRQRVLNNLLGPREFCPVVRRTPELDRFEQAGLDRQARELVQDFPPHLLRRALSYLFAKETKHSFEIENVRLSSDRARRFVSLLRQAEEEDYCTRERLIELQNQIVDPRFAENDYRREQNYVGESVSWHEERVHLVPPRPEDLPSLMQGLLACHRRMETGRVPPVVHAAVVSYGFVFLHPFLDGNGRIHRFLIHNILARRGFTPPGAIFPVSAAMLNRPKEYDESLEAFSGPLLEVVDYTLDAQGQMTVHGQTARWYRYMDLTVQAEALYRFIQWTLSEDLPQELEFLRGYDQAKRAIQEVVDMPDRKIDLLIRLLRQNQGRLSVRKRHDLFDFLTDEELRRVEAAYREAFGPGGA